MAALTGAIELIHKPGSDNVITAVLSPLISPNQPSLGVNCVCVRLVSKASPFSRAYTHSQHCQSLHSSIMIH